MQVIKIDSVNYNGLGVKKICDRAARGRVEVKEATERLVRDEFKFASDFNKLANEIADLMISNDRSIKPKTRKPLFTTSK